MTTKEELRAAEDLKLPKLGNGSGTSKCWKVQARTSKGCGPKKIESASVGMDNYLNDIEWQTLSFSSASIGVPPSPYHFDEFARHGFLSYAAAQALRWWFVAEQKGVSSYLETRLVECEFKYSYSAEAKAVHCRIESEKREDIMPDWGETDVEAVE